MLQFIYNAIWAGFNKHFQVISFRRLILKPDLRRFDSLLKWLHVTSFNTHCVISGGSVTIIYAPYLKPYASENTVCREILSDTL